MDDIVNKTCNISFVLIEYNCIEEIRACVASIHKACLNIEHEIVVSSNSVYPEKKQSELKRQFPEVQWQFNHANLGFAGGMNAGIERTRHGVVVITNPDVRIAENGIMQACDYFLSHEDVGLLGPKIIDAQGFVQDSCRRFMGPLELLSRTRQRIFRKRGVLIDTDFDYSQIQSVDWVIGAFMMIKREALDEVGILDAKYFLYVEDMDLCKRFWDHGWAVTYFPLLEVTYKGDRKSTSALVSGRLLNKYGVHHIRSYFRFLLKNKFRVSRRH